jgi:hypothetical protein
MASRPSNTEHPSAALVLILLAVTCCSVVTACLAAQSPAPGQDQRFVRPDPETIRAEIKDILADPRFAPRVSPFAQLWQWLRDKLAALRAPGFSISRPVWLAILIWCVLTLAAIIAHAVYHARLALRKPKHKATGLDFDDLERLKDKPYDELLAIMRRRAAKGRFREAIGVMMLALLRWLDDAELVIFHQSKTNGEYVREYAPGNAARPDFGRFAVSFDVAVYGHSTCDRRTYDDMNHLFEQVLDHAGEKP